MAGKPITWLRKQRPQALLPLGIAVVLVALALADRSLLGLEPPMLAVIAAVFAATSSIYMQ